MGNLACTTQHVAAVIAARGPVLVEEFGFSAEDELHGFAVGVYGLLGHGRKLSVVVPRNIGQSRAKSGIANRGHKLGDGRGLLAPVEDGLRAVGLGSVLGFEVDVRDGE